MAVDGRPIAAAKLPLSGSPPPLPVGRFYRLKRSAQSYVMSMPILHSEAKSIRYSVLGSTPTGSRSPSKAYAGGASGVRSHLCACLRVQQSTLRTVAAGAF